jgi:PTS system galactitol-specific IIB component
MESKPRYRIASVCGSGYATSGWIAAKLRSALEVKGIQADITEMKIMDLAMSAGDYDLIVSASRLSDIYNVPVITSTSIITGVGFNEILEKIITTLQKSRQ